MSKQILSRHQTSDFASCGYTGFGRKQVARQRELQARDAAPQEFAPQEFAAQEFAAHVAQMLEEDRKYIAREIHDELGQILAALHLEVMMLGCEEGARSTRRVEQIRCNMEVLLDKAFQGVRNVATNLRPAALELGIVAAIEKLSTEFTKRSSASCRLKCTEDTINLDEEQTIAVFRIVQESLTNVSRHAQASRVEITLRQNTCSFIIEVRDNGKGFDHATAGKKKTFGLLGMRERVAVLGGSIAITSTQQQGTAVCLYLPIRHL